MTEKIWKDPNEVYQTALSGLSPRQVLVPKFSGTVIKGWRLRNIRRLRLKEIEEVMKNAPSQLDEVKYARMTAREERLRGMRG